MVTFPDSWVTGRASGLSEVGCWFVDGDDLIGALHVLQLQLSPLITFITLSSNKIQNEHILVPANPDPTGNDR